MSNPLSFKERVIRAVIARLQDINPSNTPPNGSTVYGNTINPNRVFRQAIELSKLEPGDDPVLSVSPAESTYAGLVSGRQNEFLTLAIGGVISEPNPDIELRLSTISSDLIDLETDVRRAILGDPSLDGLVTHTTLTQSEYDEGLAYPFAWFVLSIECLYTISAAEPFSKV